MPYKILSLDGGASRALVQARVLQDTYVESSDMKGHELLRKFDMVIANSGGSVLLGLLCNNMSLKSIISFYTNSQELKKVYPPLYFGERFWQQLLRFLHIAGAKYSSKRKFTNLQKVFLDNDEYAKKHPLSTPVVNTYLNNLPAIIGKNYNGNDVQLVIPAFDYFRRRVSFFRSHIHSTTTGFSGRFYQITLGEAIHASCNAPVNYYDRPAEVSFNLFNDGSGKKDVSQSWFWDGAVSGFNNPVLAGLVEAITNNIEINLNEIYILSLGTGQPERAIIVDDETSSDPGRKEKYKLNYRKPFVEWQRSFSFLQDIKKMSTSILSEPPDSASFIAYSFMNRALNNEDTRLVRINPLITPSLNNSIYEYPAVYNTNQKEREDFLKLMKLDFDVYKKDDINLIWDMCDRFIVNDSSKDCLPNQLIRGEINDDTHIGYSTYREAKRRWKKLNDEQ